MLYFIIYLILFYVNDSVVLTKKMCSQSENGIPDRTLISSFILKLDRSALHVFCFLIKVVNNIMQSVTGNSTGIHVHCKPG